MYKDTGSTKSEKNDVPQEHDATKATEATEAGTEREATTADSGSAVPDAGRPEDANLIPVSPSESATVDADGSLENDSTMAETEKEPLEEVPTYSQAYVDRLKSQYERERQFSENRLREVENELKEKNEELNEKDEKIQSLCNDSRERDNIRDSIFALVGDTGSPAKTYEVVKIALKYQSEAEKAKKLQREYNELLKTKETIEKWYMETHQKCLALQADLDASKKDLEQKTKELEQRERELEDASQTNAMLSAQCEVGERVLKASVPACLASMEWFDAFFKELKDGLQGDPMSDSAMLVMASLAELSVMERDSVSSCFEWKKQLADIGLVVANYMHQKRSAEGDVLKVLRNFSQALQEMPILKKLRIGFKVPSLGSDFNTDEVKHKDNGSSIGKVLNWCIVEDGHVYCKAIVE